MSPRPDRPTPAVAALAGLFLTSGTLHLARPEVFEPIVPKALPAHRELVYVSGVAELACGVGLLHPRTRPLAGPASALLLAAVFPANVQMSLSYGRRAVRTARPRDVVVFLATLARLPLQWPMVRTAMSVRGQTGPARRRGWAHRGRGVGHRPG